MAEENAVDLFLNAIPSSADIRKQMDTFKASAKQCRVEAKAWDRKASILRRLSRVADVADVNKPVKRRGPRKPKVDPTQLNLTEASVDDVEKAFAEVA